MVGYFIHYRATHTAGKYLKVTVLGANTRSHIISHLLPDTGYDIKMQSFNEAGTSEFSNIFMSKTKRKFICRLCVICNLFDSDTVKYFILFEK